MANGHSGRLGWQRRIFACHHPNRSIRIVWVCFVSFVCVHMAHGHRLFFTSAEPATPTDDGWVVIVYVRMYTFVLYMKTQENQWCLFSVNRWMVVDGNVAENRYMNELYEQILTKTNTSQYLHRITDISADDHAALVLHVNTSRCPSDARHTRCCRSEQYVEHNIFCT